MPPPPLFTPRFLALWLFQFGTFFAAFQLLPVIPLRILALGGSKMTAGLFLAVYTFSSAFAAPVMGAVADHVGRRRMLVIASALFVVFSLAYGVIPWLPLVLGIAVVHGALWSSILSAGGAIMVDYIPMSRRTEGLAYWGLAPTIAISVAPPVGLWVHKFGWFVLCAEIAAFSGFMAFWASRLPRDNARRRLITLVRPVDLWDWSVIRAALSLAVISFGYGGVTSYVVVLSNERGISPESLFFTVFALTVVLIRVSISPLGDRFGPRVLLYPSLVAMPLAYALLAVASNRTQMITAAILFGIGMGASFPAFMNFIVTNTDAGMRGRTFGSVIWAFDTGIGLGSVVTGAIGQQAGLGAAFAVAAAISCLAIPIFAATSRQFTRGTSVAAEHDHG